MDLGLCILYRAACANVTSLSYLQSICRYPMKKPSAAPSTAALFAFLAAALASLAISCSGGGGNGPSAAAPGPAPGPVPGLCSHAFDPAVSRMASVPAASPTMPAPAALSSCALDANRDVVIGSGGCGPLVYVD